MLQSRILGLVLVYLSIYSHSYIIKTNPRNHHCSYLNTKLFDTKTPNLSLPLDHEIRNRLSNLNIKISSKCKEIKKDFEERPWTYLSIPISAAVIGYVTNYLGVSMLFYPLEWTGINIYRLKDQPFGFFGWQGIVPARKFVMSNRLVDVTIERLLSIPEAFSRLDPEYIAKLLIPTVRKDPFIRILPIAFVRQLLRNTAVQTIKNIESVVDIRTLVVNGEFVNKITLRLRM